MTTSSSHPSRMVRVLFRKKKTGRSTVKVFTNIRLNGIVETPKQLHLGYVPLLPELRPADRRRLSGHLSELWSKLFPGETVEVDWEDAAKKFAALRERIIAQQGLRREFVLDGDSCKLKRTEQRIADATIEFQVSQDQEFVSIQLTQAEHVITLRPRVYAEMLLRLALVRLKEQESDNSARSAGWVYTDELSRWIGQPLENLNVHIHRLRCDIAAANIAADPDNIIERRHNTGQLRLGVRKILIHSE